MQKKIKMKSVRNLHQFCNYAPPPTARNALCGWNIVQN